MAATVKQELSPVAKQVSGLFETKRNLTLAEVVRKATDARDVALRKAGKIVSAVTAQLPVPSGAIGIEKHEAAAFRKFMQIAQAMPATPTTVRELTEDELKVYVAYFVALKEVEAITKRGTTALRAAVLNHLTVQGERLETVTDETQRDKTGWALVAAKFRAEDVPGTLSVEPSAGDVSIPVDAIKALEEQKVITRTDRLKCVVHTPTLDQAGLMDLIRRKPQVAEELARYVSVAAPKVSLYKR